jgi:hypothetical protein
VLVAQEDVRTEKKISSAGKIFRMEFSLQKMDFSLPSRRNYPIGLFQIIRARNVMDLLCMNSRESNKISGMHAPTILKSSAPLAEWKLQVEIQQALNNRLTGQIQLTFSSGRTETILARNGVVEALFLRNHRLPSLDWDSPVGRNGRGTLSIEPLPERALLFKKVMIEELQPPAPQSAGTSQLKAMLNLVEHGPGPTLFHIHWERAEAFVLVAGEQIPVRHAVLITPSETEEGSHALERILTWGEGRCSVTIYRGNIRNQAWLELYLNILFEWYCSMVLTQYGRLTGTVMVQSIVRRSAMLGARKGLHFEPLKTELKDTSLFQSAAEAGNTYNSVLFTIYEQIEPIIGRSLAQTIMEQAFSHTRGGYRIIADIFEMPGKRLS